MTQFRMTYLLLFVSVLMIFGCSGGDSSPGQKNIGGQGTGTLALSLTDTPTDGLQAVYITIEDIKVCASTRTAESGDNLDAADDGCRWEVIAEPNATYNLLELVNGVTETLGVAELSAGTYDQMRLKIGAALGNDEESVTGFNIFGEEHPHANYLIDKDGKVQHLKIPSGVQSGVKLVHAFEIEENKYTELIIDFDASRSIVQAGKKDKYILKPTINVVDTKQMAKLSGSVTDTDGDPIELVSVSAQRMENSPGMILAASTMTDDTGGYQLLLEKHREYTVVVFSNAHTPACILINISEDDPNYLNFSLEAAEESREVSGTITNVAKGAEVSLSIRKIDQNCGNSDQEIELLSETIAQDERSEYVYSVILPVGEGYKVVYSDGMNTSYKIFKVEPDLEQQQENLVF